MAVLAAAAFLLYRRKIQGDRQAAKQWVQRVIAEARANLNEEIGFRFTEVEFVFNSTLDDALERERTGQTALLRTADVAEGMRAFAEKRRPVFRGD